MNETLYTLIIIMISLQRFRHVNWFRRYVGLKCGDVFSHGLKPVGLIYFCFDSW